jgi:hypothetical protein
MDPALIHPTPAPSSTTRRPLLHTDDLDRFDAISARLGNIGTAAQRFHALLEWVEQQLESNPTQAAVVLPVVSDQAKTLAWLTEEIGTLRLQLAEAHRQIAAAQQEAEAARTWRSERSLMQAKIDSLAGENQTLRRRLERFDSLRQVLMGDSHPQSHSTSPEAPQTSPAAPGDTETPDSTSSAAPPSSSPRTRRPDLANNPRME